MPDPAIEPLSDSVPWVAARLPTDAEMDALRQTGAFICTCRPPMPCLIPMFAVYECATCGRKVI